MRNKLGWSMAIEKAGLLAEAGFDYIECPVSSLQLEDEAGFKEKLPLFLDSPLPVKAMNSFFPRGMMIVGPETDRDRIHRYVGKLGEAVGRIGSEIVVLGSGASRSIPEGWDPGRAEEQMLELMRLIVREWEGNGAVVALEPLNRRESNWFNRVEEGVQLARQLNHPAIQVLADFYHMDEEQEPIETIVEHKDWLAHIHVADTGRLAPGTGAYPYDQFTGALKTIGYQGMISSECKLQGTDGELARSLAFMRKVFAAD